MLLILRSPRAALIRHLRTRSRGQSLVEFALILPIFMLFFAAVLDLGRIAGAQIAVSNAAREGVFQAAVTPTAFDSTKPCPVDDTDKSNLIYCRIKLESSGGVSVAPTDVRVNCSPVDCSTGVGNTVTVAVTGHFRLFTPLMAVFFGGNQNVTFTGSATSNRETLPVDGASPAPTASASPSPSPSGSASPSPSASATPMTCVLPSAGFSYSSTPSSAHSPVTLTVVDSSTSINCGITSWLWTWGDGTTTLGKVPGPHTYGVPNPNGSGYYNVTLKVTNAAGSTTSGGVQIAVKP
jgi:Flp pilus assembly protein TadG